VYYSSYEEEALEALSERLKHDSADETWCIFDNTASGGATSNALALAKKVAAP
jgi:uncharacterized protein YecE (DUF72 family)